MDQMTPNTKHFIGLKMNHLQPYKDQSELLPRLLPRCGGGSWAIEHVFILGPKRAGPRVSQKAKDLEG